MLVELGSKYILFDGLWKALLETLERLLGSLGALSGGSTLQKYNEEQYEMHMFKNAHFRHWCCLGPVLEAILAHFFRFGSQRAYKMY